MDGRVKQFDITITIIVDDNAEEINVEVNVIGDDASTLEVLGALQLARDTHLSSKKIHHHDVDDAPDLGYLTTPAGDCISVDPCMHTPQAWDIMHSMCTVDNPCSPDCG